MNEIIHWNQQTEFTETKDVVQPLIRVGGGGLQPKVIKQVNVIGGTGDLWGDKQYRQQHRVIDKKQVAYAVTAELMNNAVVKHYESRNKTSD